MTVTIDTFLEQLRSNFGHLPVRNDYDVAGGDVAREVRYVERSLEIIRRAGAEIPDLLEDPLDAAGREKSFTMLRNATAGDVFEQFQEASNKDAVAAIIRLHRNLRRIKEAI